VIACPSVPAFPGWYQAKAEWPSELYSEHGAEGGKMNKIMTSICAAMMAVTMHAQTVTPLMSKDIPEFPGKEVEIITVQFAPGAVDPIHRHNAHVFVYVLEGEVIMQVKGGVQQELGPGQTFYEGPDDIHTVGRNASKTKPAKFLVFFIKNKKAPILTLVK
jgi:quercetin dioxygenase-like cupin family protein